MQHVARMDAPVPTLREIAKACGYNNSTVSRALSNKASIPASTRQHILQIAKKMGWRPNPLASAYMAHYRSTRAPKYQASLAYVISFSNVDKFEDLWEFLQLNFQGAKERAAAQGFELEPVWLRDLDFNFGRLARLLKNRGIPGLVVHGGKLPEDAFRAFDWNSFAGATWGYSVRQPRLHRAAFHWPHGIRTALEKIRRLGYKRIALILSDELNHLTDYSLASTFYYGERHPGFQESLKSLVFDPMDPGMRKKIRLWIERNRPQAIIGTKEVWQVLGEMKWHVPGDVAFVSPHWSSRWPEIGGIDQLPEVIGANAVDLAVSQLMQNQRGVPAIPKLLLNEGRWVDGKSIPSRRPSARTERVKPAATREAAAVS